MVNVSEIVARPFCLSGRNGVVDEINPCSFAVLIILLTTILVAKAKKRAIGAGLAFSLSITSFLL